MMALEPGTTIGPYAVTAKIGGGGMGEVYQATDTSLDRQVAIKVLPQARKTNREDAILSNAAENGTTPDIEKLWERLTN